MYPRNQKNKSPKKIIIIVLCTMMVLILAGLAAYWFMRDETPSITTSDGDTVVLTPATDQEKKQADDNKQNIISQNEKIESSTPAAGAKRQVTPTITSAGSGGVNGYINGVFEEGGTCTAQFTKGSASFSRSSSGFQNASYTQCAPIAVSPSDFSSGGTWNVVLSYSSTSSNGSSAPQTFEVTK